MLASFCPDADSQISLNTLIYHTRNFVHVPVVQSAKHNSKNK